MGSPPVSLQGTTSLNLSLVASIMPTGHCPSSLWHCPSSTRSPPALPPSFLRPAAPQVAATARHAVLTSLFVWLVNDAFTEEAYVADLAGLYYSLDGVYAGTTSDRGLTLSVWGFAEQLPRFTRDVAAAIVGLAPDPQRLDVAKERVERALRNAWLRPEAHARDLCLAVLCDGVFSPAEKLAALRYGCVPS